MVKTFILEKFNLNFSSPPLFFIHIYNILSPWLESEPIEIAWPCLLVCSPPKNEITHNN